MQSSSVITQMIAKPCGVDENGIHLPPTFMPQSPDMIVGMDITIVIAARYFITLFRRLLMTVDQFSGTIDDVTIDLCHLDRLSVLNDHIL